MRKAKHLKIKTNMSSRPIRTIRLDKIRLEKGTVGLGRFYGAGDRFYGARESHKPLDGVGDAFPQLRQREQRRHIRLVTP